MKITVLTVVLTFLVLGCSKNEQAKTDQPSQTATVAADNSGTNVRARNNATKTSGDQSESEGDRTISQNIRPMMIFGKEHLRLLTLRCRKYQYYMWVGTLTRKI